MPRGSMFALNPTMHCGSNSEHPFALVSLKTNDNTENRIHHDCRVLKRTSLQFLISRMTKFHFSCQTLSTKEPIFKHNQFKTKLKKLHHSQASISSTPTLFNVFRLAQGLHFAMFHWDDVIQSSVKDQGG